MVEDSSSVSVRQQGVGVPEVSIFLVHNLITEHFAISSSSFSYFKVKIRKMWKFVKFFDANSQDFCNFAEVS